MKFKTSIRSLLVMLVMALMFTTIAPVVLPQTHVAEAAKKKKSSKKKSSKKSKKATVNLKINKTMATVKVGKGTTLKVSGNAKKAVKWSATSKNVKLSKKSGNKIKVTGVKEGVAAVVAKVGKSKVVCAVYVGKGTYASASSKTKKAIGNPIALLASYIAKHPISIQTGNISTDGSPNASVDNEIYSLSVVGSNIIVSYTQTSQDREGTNKWERTMSIPINGTPVANLTYTASYASGEVDTYTTSVNMNSVTPGTEIQYSYTYAGNGYNSSGTAKTYLGNYRFSGIIDVLYCFLVDNNTGFTTNVMKLPA